MKNSIILIGMLTLLSCRRTNNINIDATKVHSINVDSFDGKSYVPFKRVNDMEQINSIVACINHAAQEPVKFIPRYRLTFVMENENFSAVISGEYISLNKGAKYHLGCNLEKKLTSFDGKSFIGK